MTVRHEEKHGRFMINFWYRHADGHRERIRVVAQGTNRRQAEAEERSIRVALDAGVYQREEEVKEPEKQTPTLEEFSGTFIKLHAVPNCKPRTADLYRQFFRLYLLPDIGPLRLDEIDKLAVDKLKAKLLGSGLGKKSVRNALGLLSKTLHYAEETGTIEAAPRMKLPPAPPSDFDFLDFGESDRLLDAARAETDPTWHAAILFALRTGARRGEIFELRWSDIDLEAQRVDIRRSHSRGYTTLPKSNRGRSVALSAPTVEVLAALKEGQTRTIDGDDLVFARSDGVRLSKSAADRALARICRRAGISREPSWHKLRHTTASHLVMRGQSIRVVQDVLGHSTVAMAVRYAHLAPAVTARAIADLDRPWEGLGNGWATERNASGSEVAKKP